MAEQKEKQGFHPLKRIKGLAAKAGTLNLILILVGIFFIWFNAQMLNIFQIYGAIPESYACAVIAATIGECGICGWIRTNKDKRQDRKWQKEDEAEMKQAPGLEPDIEHQKMEGNINE